MSFYSLEDAEDVLPEVERILKETRRLHRKILRLAGKEEEIELSNEEKGISLRFSFVEGTEEVDELIKKMNSKIALIEQAGIILKDIEEGLIEFPSVFQGKNIAYVWKIGMKHISLWVSEDDGFEKQQKIIDMSKKGEQHDNHHRKD